MATRLEFQAFLEELLNSDAVYFQPPPNIKMTYPCLVYNRSNIIIDHANNMPYSHKKQYLVTVIDRDPDSDIPNRLAQVSTASFERHFTVDGLNHDVFRIFF